VTVTAGAIDTPATAAVGCCEKLSVASAPAVMLKLLLPPFAYPLAAATSE
jgi:hypothetical protein